MENTDIETTHPYEYWYDALPCAYGGPVSSGKIKVNPEDFVVEEQLSFELDNQGEHVYVFVEKSELNTDEVARRIARQAGVKSVDIGYAGLKDRNAVTRQWFSVRYPVNSELDLSPVESDRLKVVEQCRNSRKLRRGAITGNRFKLVVRDIGGAPDLLDDRLRVLRDFGFPNYFGEQRFGHHGDNIKQVFEMFEGKRRVNQRHLRSLLISSARSFLFNQLLAARIQNRTWNHAIHGDLMQLDGTNRFFKLEQIDQVILERVHTLDIHPTGVMWGSPPALVEKTAYYLELNALSSFPELMEGLERAGLKQERRALRVRVKEMDWAFIDQQTLELSFMLPPGAYATVLLREVFG